MSTNFNLSSPPHSPDSEANYSAPPITVTLTIILLVFFFGGIFSIYLCRCFMAYLINSSNLRNSSRMPSSNAVQPTGGGGVAPANGLDPSIIATFPTFVYSSVKNLRQDKCGLECAVCLAEFEDDDELRLLTVCNHVFHPDCIDLWFGNHTTCPLCRRSLLPSEKPPPDQNNNNDIVVTVTPPAAEENDQQQESRTTREDNNSVSTKDEEEEEHEEMVLVVVVDKGDHSHDEGATTSAIATQDDHGNGGRQVHVEKNKAVKRFPRWHSTGHSLIRAEPDPNDERYTLRLPDHIKEHIVRGHKWTGSCTTFGELSNNAGKGSRKGGLAELSGFSGGDVTRV
ncbi:RING-H2 finger protein ATL29-like [Macadamia integrifolia]|uniref:RING-H2 finger protein ATL29-like n=1 Tax=Macadamia integrifolia TaxID=60698 RepID=UPI001C4FC504|nr:RING-H2 finger protein ATL29-like [Macadamia integrifolia]